MNYVMHEYIIHHFICFQMTDFLVLINIVMALIIINNYIIIVNQHSRKILMNYFSFWLYRHEISLRYAAHVLFRHVIILLC